MQDRAAQLGDKVVYQIYVRSFNDSNGDGIGDLRGITQRLDYLKRLGVDYLWITPFFSSPQNDNGYDVADYRSVEPMFGTMEDFDELSREAKARGIGLMLDMVFNHTSTSHEWFRRALSGDPRYLAYYKFVDAAPNATAANPGEPPTNWASKFGGSAWEYVPSLHKWYLHLFDVSQADLNWDNPEVRAELADVVRFWKAKGVSGFRFDVVNLISKPERLEDDLEGDGRRFYTDGPHVHEYLQELVREGGIEDMVTVGEMSSTSIENCIRYTAPRYHELTQAFSFHHLKVDYAGGDKWALAEPDIPRLRGLLRDWQERMTAGGGWNALFWSNHDQPRPNSRFGDCSTRELWRRSSELLPVCTHLLRGTPYVYQGEELGMTNPDFTSIDQYRDVESLNYYKILQDEGATPEEAFRIVRERSRDDSRTPVQWDGGANAGFTSGTPWIGIPANHAYVNAADEMADPDSVWSFYRRIIALRKECPVIQAGDVRFLDAASEKVIAYERTLGDAARGPRRLVVACNFGGTDAAALPAGEVEGGSVLIENCDEHRIQDGTLELGPWCAVAFAW
ncbi:alpha,alpha-phosphotrehalase [Parafannyhessea sp. LCP21S3_E6]|uniref:alpha,alpha-phosphotrehalase n=1 Tax=unclassified Parafannyhessea TaxID=2847323 RepID=UPI003F9964D2